MKKEGPILIAETQESLGELHLLSTHAYNVPAKKKQRDAFGSCKSQRLPAGVIEDSGKLLVRSGLRSDSQGGRGYKHRVIFGVFT